MNRDKIRTELLAIQGRRPLLSAINVVRWAKKHKDSELHKHFQWNVQKAAEQHWLMQAREIIKVTIVSEPDTPQWVSLSIDRYNEDGGYRTFEDVIGTKSLRKTLLQDVVNEFVRLRSRYSDLTELTDVYSAIDNAAETFTETQEQPAAMAHATA